MTTNEHDNSEASQEDRSTELYPFARGYPRPFNDTQPDLPAMEQLPDPDALPDPGYPEMPEPQDDADDLTDFPPADEPADGPADGPTSASADEPTSGLMEGPMEGPADRSVDTSEDGPGARPWPRPPEWPSAPLAPSFQPATEYPDEPPSAAPRPVWSPDPYTVPRTPDAAPPLRGPAVPWSEVRAAADRDVAADADPEPEPLPAPPSLRPHPEAAAPPLRPEREAGSAWLRPDPEAAPPPLRRPPEAASPWFGPDPEPAAPWLRPEPEAGPAPVSQPPPEEFAQRPTSDALTSEVLLPGKRATPDGGWRRTVYRATGGLVRVGESSASLRRRELVSRIRTPVAGGHHRVAVLSLKGGVGKTTVTVGLGATLASLRGDRVIAVDGNPDRGTLSDKVTLETTATIRDLLNQRAMVSRYADVRALTSQAPSRLEILASDRDPGVSVAFSADDYRAVVGVLEHYYSICITDCGTGLLHSAMAGILELADQVVLVSSPSVDGARSASATLDWLEAHEYGDLVRGGVVVLSGVRRKSRSAVDLDRLEQHFAARSRAVVRIPYDTHLEEGAEVQLDYLNSDTAEAYLTLAALVADGFARPRRPAPKAAPGSRLA
jgi:MinD-like ATPase involved in chromosome partitioning or flagellar assembly